MLCRSTCDIDQKHIFEKGIFKMRSTFSRRPIVWPHTLRSMHIKYVINANLFHRKIIPPYLGPQQKEEIPLPAYRYTLHGLSLQNRQGYILY